LLINVVPGGIEPSHGVAVYDINVRVLAGADGEVAGLTRAVDEIRQHERAA